MVYDAVKAGEGDARALLAASDGTRWLRHIQTMMMSIRSIVQVGPCCAALLCWALCLRTPPGHLSMGWV